jgi:hypothetical protein
MKHVHEKVATSGPNFARQVQEVTRKVAQLVAEVPGLASLASSERKRLPKMRTGGERYILQMARLGSERPEARPAAVDPAQTAQYLGQADELGALHAALATALQLVDDAILFRQSHAWSDALDTYAVAERAAHRNPELEAALAPFRAVLAHGPKGAAPAPTSTAAE